MYVIVLETERWSFSTIFVFHRSLANCFDWNGGVVSLLVNNDIFKTFLSIRIVNADKLYVSFEISSTYLNLLFVLHVCGFL